MNEEEVYRAVTNYLRKSGWAVVGGQPPSGTDHMPVIEIKDPEHVGKGSKGSLKPDLVACRSSSVLIVEVKPLFSKSDRTKLLSVLKDQRRLSSLVDELKQRGLLHHVGPRAEQTGAVLEVVGALGYAGRTGDLKGLWGLRVDPCGSVELIVSDPSFRVLLTSKGVPDV